VGPEAALEQRLRDAPHLAVGFAVGQLAPGIAFAALGEENPFRRLVGPMHQPLGDAARMRAQLLRRAQQHAAVGSLLQLDFGGREPHSDVTSFSQAAMLRRWESRIFVNRSLSSALMRPSDSSKRFTAHFSPRTRYSMRAFGPFTATALS